MGTTIRADGLARLALRAAPRKVHKGRKNGTSKLRRAEEASRTRSTDEAREYNRKRKRKWRENPQNRASEDAQIRRPHNDSKLRERRVPIAVIRDTRAA